MRKYGTRIVFILLVDVVSGSNSPLEQALWEWRLRDEYYENVTKLCSVRKALREELDKKRMEILSAGIIRLERRQEKIREELHSRNASLC